MKHVILIGIVIVFVSCMCVYDEHMNKTDKNDASRLPYLPLPLPTEALYHNKAASPPRICAIT